MAYNTKYILKYCNAKGVELRIELQIWDYIGQQFILVNGSFLTINDNEYVVSNIDGEYDYERDVNPIEAGSNPFSIRYHNDNGSKDGAIRALEANMEFYQDNLFNIDDLATSDETEIRCVFYYDNKVEFIGFVTPDFFYHEITQNPLIQLTASDRIGILKDVDYSVDTTIDQKVRYIDIIVKCLKETGLDLPINIVCQMYCDELTPAFPVEGYAAYELVNPFVSGLVSEWRTMKDLEKEETLDCYTILQSIMNQFNCLLTQKGGEWWIVNKADLDHGKGIVFGLDPNGNQVSFGRMEFGEITFNLMDTGGQRAIIPAGAKNTYILDNGEEQVYPKNNKLQSESTSLDSAPFWTRRTLPSDSVFTKDIATKYNDNNDGTIVNTYENRERVLAIREDILSVISNDTTNFTPMPQDVNGHLWLLQSSEFNVVTMDRVTSSFKITVKAIGKPYTGIPLGLFMKIKDGSNVEHIFSLRSIINGNEFTNDYIFYKVTDINTTGTINVIPLFFENKHNSRNVPSEQTFEINVSIAKGSLQTYDIRTAKLFFRIYPSTAYIKGGSNPYNLGLNQVNNFVKSVTLEFTNDEQVPTGTVFQSRLSRKFTKPTDERKVMFGDYQTFGQNGYFYNGREDALSIHYNSNSLRLANWFTPYDAERNPLLIHSLRQLTYSNGRAHDELSIGFDLDRIDPLAHYAVRCRSDKKVLVNPEDDYLLNNNSNYITATTGKYLDSKRYVFVDGEIDYLRSHFKGKLAQIRTNEVQHQEYIYSYFEQGDIS